jgi:hypothetical protein
MEGEMGNRRAIRHKKRLKVMFGAEEANKFGFLEDISKTGLRLNSRSVYEPGTMLKLDIHDDVSDCVMLAEGYVAWTAHYPGKSLHNLESGMGIHFKKIDPMLRRFCQTLKISEEQIVA